MDYSKFRKIESFIFDVDGVFTDCGLIITEQGEFLRKMNVRDGAAVKIALNQGYRIAIITKGNSIGVKDRLKFLGADPIFDKVFLIHYLRECGYIYQNIARLDL